MSSPQPPALPALSPPGLPASEWRAAVDSPRSTGGLLLGPNSSSGPLCLFNGSLCRLRNDSELEALDGCSDAQARSLLLDPHHAGTAFHFDGAARKVLKPQVEAHRLPRL